MNLIDAVQAILRNRCQTVSESQWARSRQDLEDAIVECKDAEQLRASIAFDADDELPVDLKSLLYRQLLEMGGREPTILRQYAWHLQLHGPDWDDDAAALLAEADGLDEAP